MTATRAALAAARLELHWAAQLASAPGATLLPPAADASHTNLGWDDALGGLVGRAIPSRDGRSASLRFDDLTLAVGDARLGLAGRTLDEATAWLANAFGVGALTRPAHELPDHAVARGEPFGAGDAGARAELAAWFRAAASAIGALATPVRCWPHHFDIAALREVAKERSVGVGFSPGDASYDEPYFYVTPWPYPSADSALPALARGHWHREGWTGAVLEAKDVAGDPSSPAIAAWLDEALRGALSLVEAR